MAPALAVIHEDRDLLVVDKPAGLVCHPTKAGPTSSLIGQVRLYLGHAEGRLVNRLDRETSGVVVVAKHKEAASALGRLFAGSAVFKRYLAVVHGDPGPLRHIDAPLGRDEGSAVAIKDRVRADGAPAETRVRRLAIVSHASGSLAVVEARPRTGRKHQIRIHLAHIGHPVVGDKIYGGDETRYLRFVAGTLSGADRAALLVPCHALHAAELGFDWEGTPYRWTAALPPHVVWLADGLDTRGRELDWGPGG